MEYSSSRTVQSREYPCVCFTIARISFGRKLELTRRVRELGRLIEFQQAGQSLADRLDVAIAGAEIDRLYLEVGLIHVHGLHIDGKPATKESLIEAGPDRLCREIVSEIRRECGLTAEEIKN